jgi:hypothetical protein
MAKYNATSTEEWTVTYDHDHTVFKNFALAKTYAEGLVRNHDVVKELRAEQRLIEILPLTEYKKVYYSNGIAYSKLPIAD